jgi:preprotein translocase SecE subunit
VTAQTTDAGGSASAAAERTPPPMNYHVPFTEVTDPTGYPIRVAGGQKSSVQVEEALKKHPDVSEAVVVPTPGDAQSDRATAYLELKVRDGKRAGLTPKLEEELQEAAATSGLPAANVTVKTEDSLVKGRSGGVNRRFYHERLAGREANEDATALLPLVPVANLTLPLLICLLTVWVAWRAVNVPTFGDFLIATEAEMNKVSWTSRKRLIQDTIVVIVCLALLTAFLLVIDLFWGWLLSLKFIGVLPEKSATDAADVANPAGNLKW